MTHASLFSGIGGFDLAAQWMGWDNVFQVEIDSFCQKVLQKNFPKVTRYGDIKEFEGTKYRGSIDVLSGGFPCQPYSLAGKRKGKEDDRHLWPEMLRVIREIQPSFVVGENVYGLVNWSNGLVFDEVQTSLEAEGYEVTSVILPACSIDAPHRRDRVWFIAHASSKSCKLSVFKWRQSTSGNTNIDRPSSSRPFANSYPQRLPIRFQSTKRSYQKAIKSFSRCKSTRIHSENDWREFPTQSGICRGDDGIPNRVDRIKALGNAIVPQVALEIFKAISVCKYN